MNEPIEIPDHSPDIKIKSIASFAQYRYQQTIASERKENNPLPIPNGKKNITTKRKPASKQTFLIKNAFAASSSERVTEERTIIVIDDDKPTNSKPDFVTRVSNTSSFTKDELLLLQYRCELSDNLAKQADLKTKERKLRMEIKRLLKRSNKSVNSYYRDVERSKEADSKAETCEVVDESNTTNQYFPLSQTTITATTSTNKDDTIIDTIDGDSSSIIRSSNHNTRWCMSYIDDTFDEVSANLKFNESSFQ